MTTANDKAYDKNLDRKCSPAALAVSLRTCTAFGMTKPRKNSEDVWTGHIYDLVFDYFGKEVRVETELKREWKEDWSRSIADPDVPYRWPTMDVPYRKRDKGILHANWHHIVGGDGKRAFWAPRKVVLSSPVSDKYCRNRQCEEPFFNIPLPSPMTTFWEEVNGVWKITHHWGVDGTLKIRNGVVL